MKWDCTIGGQSFLFATSQQNMYRRETADFRRTRVDQERDFGEQSLDSGYWLRSQVSFHMGAGITSTEPLSVPEDEARFRFNASRGVDPWTPGELRLLKDTVLTQAGTSSTYMNVLGIDSTNALFTDGSSMKGVWTDGSAWYSFPITNPLTGFTEIRSVTSTGSRQYFCGANQIAEYVPGGVPSPVTNLLYNGGIDLNLLRWLKQRLIAADGAGLIEITNLSPTSPPVAMPAPFYTHPTDGWTWADAAEGPEAIYVSGYSNDTSGIYSVSITDDGAGGFTLGTPTLVVDMPRGERVLSTYSYLGTYLIVGTNKGVRVAQIRDGGSLALGPILIDVVTEGASVATDHGCYDAVAEGRYVWVTVGDGRENLWRLDLGQPLTSDLRFAVASDLHRTDGARVLSVTNVGGTVMFALAGTGLIRAASTYLSSGWLETGRIRMGTLQPKAWRDATLLRVPDATYVDSMEARMLTSSEPDGPWTSAVSLGPATPIANKAATGEIASPSLGPDLYVRIELQPTLSGTQIQQHSPVVTGYQVSSIPAPTRSRLVSVPLQAFDFEKDRNGAQTGYEGFAWSRLSALEDLESSSGVVVYTDHTTGETRDAYIERVSFTRMTPPFRGDNNAGGVAVALLRLVT